MSDPGAVVLAGDWHANTGWSRHVIDKAAQLLRREKVKLILHAGDLCVWPGDAGGNFLDEITHALWKHKLKVLFADGNHEWHPELRAMAEEHRHGGGTGPVPITYDEDGEARVLWLPRGHRWTWHRKTWMALGGAVSVDAAVRTKGKSWWPEETLTGEQLKHATRPGKVHAMLTHDSPSAVKMTFGQPPSFWDVMDLARSHAHRDQLQDVVDKIQPELLVHGHYHRVVRQVIEPYGTRVMGLDMDGEPGNFALLDTRTLQEVPPPHPWLEEMDE